MKKTPPPARKGKDGASTRRGWGVLSAAELRSRKEGLLAMGFSADAIEAVLATCLDYNAALDKLLIDATMTTDEASSSHSESRLSNSSESVRRKAEESGTGPRIPEIRSSPLFSSREAETSECRECKEFEKSADTEARDPKWVGNDKADWQILLGLPETALPVASGIGLSSLRPLGAVSQAVGEASDAVFPIVKQMTQHIASRVGSPSCQLARVLHSNVPETCDSNQLLIECGTLIQVFPATATSIGWMYAERLCGSALAGWVPTNSVKVLPDAYQLRQVAKTCHTVSDRHLAVSEGDIILVREDTRTEGGWTYAEHVDGSRTGWIPAGVVECIRSGLEWRRCMRSQAARHETEMSVRSNTLLLVDRGTSTKEGWVYAWGRDGYSEDAVGKNSLSGWVPTDCLEWHED